MNVNGIFIFIIILYGPGREDVPSTALTSDLSATSDDV